MSTSAKIATVVLLLVLSPIVYFFWLDYAKYIYYAVLVAWSCAIVFFMVDIVVSVAKKKAA